MSLQKALGKLKRYVNREEHEESVVVEENFFSKNYQFVRYALSFKLFRVYLIVYILANTSLVLMGSFGNLVVLSLGQKSVNLSDPRKHHGFSRNPLRLGQLHFLFDLLHEIQKSRWLYVYLCFGEVF